MDSFHPTAQTNGIIFNIQKFSVHDGPGIRSTVFLKGCPLRCRWCCNPESQRFEPEVSRNRVRCLGTARCGACLMVCAHRALASVEAGVRRDLAACMQCGACASACPAEGVVLVGRQTSAGELMEELSLDAPFYGIEGGVTLSGGEALSQPEFAAALCKEGHRHGLSMALETSAAVDWQNIQRVCAHADYLLVDVKHMDPVRHKEGTGVDNARILENIQRLPTHFPGLPLTLRCPVVPGFNDDVAHIAAVGRFAGSIAHARLELLPYHRLGQGKYENLGRTYPLDAVYAPPPDRMHRLRTVAGEFVHVI